MKFKKWIPEMMLGAMMAAMVTVPVMADNINSGSTPPSLSENLIFMHKFSPFPSSVTLKTE